MKWCMVQCFTFPIHCFHVFSHFIPPIISVEHVLQQCVLVVLPGLSWYCRSSLVGCSLDSFLLSLFAIGPPSTLLSCVPSVSDFAILFPSLWAALLFHPASLRVHGSVPSALFYFPRLRPVIEVLGLFHGGLKPIDVLVLVSGFSLSPAVLQPFCPSCY